MGLAVNEYYEEGLKAMQKGDLDIAEKWFLRSIEAYPKDVYSYNKLAFVYNEKKRFDDAVQILKKAISVKEGGDLFSHYILGNTYLDKGDFRSAITEFKRAVEINQKDVYSWNSLALAYKLAGDFDMALECLDKAIFIDPKDVYNYSSKAIILFQRGQIEESRIVIEKGLEIAPDNYLLSQRLVRFLRSWSAIFLTRLSGFTVWEIWSLKKRISVMP
jgi:tetratricopeptide (TPR) repeat protein